jgi:hypothetical protein
MYELRFYRAKESLLSQKIISASFISAIHKKWQHNSPLEAGEVSNKKQVFINVAQCYIVEP